MRKIAVIFTAVTAFAVALSSVASPVAADRDERGPFPKTIALPDGFAP